jgi:hypothetical protein
VEETPHTANRAASTPSSKGRPREGSNAHVTTTTDVTSWEEFHEKQEDTLANTTKHCGNTKQKGHDNINTGQCRGTTDRRKGDSIGSIYLMMAAEGRNM